VVTNETLEILKNTEIIAINQDPVIGTAVTPFRWGINVGVFIQQIDRLQM
jgi:alpha-galactosidase